MKRAVKILSIIVGVVGVLVIAAFAYYFGVTGSVHLQRKQLTLNRERIRIYDVANVEIAGAQDDSAANFSELPDHLPHAFVAVEDKRFYSHHGFDYKRMIKAAGKNLISFSFREGASTISQQLIKNTHLTGEKTINRKLKEYKLTRILEKNYSKDEILELYLNSIYFGHSAFGAKKASAFYFGKEVSDLTPAESAMLAALVKSPNRYSPFKNPDKCLARRNQVLKLMREQGYLDETAYQTAHAEPLPDKPHEIGINSYLTKVYEELEELEIAGNSIKVYTFCNTELQAELDKTETESDVCIVVRDNETNGISALHTTCGILNRLPASTIKPLLVYAPALEENLISPLTPVLDKETDFSGYRPHDYKAETGDYMSARYALAHSVNIPAVRILNELGVENGVKYLEKMNLEVEGDDFSLALALGGMKNGFTLPALSDGYAVFANGGSYSPSQTISHIVGENGKELYRFRPAKHTVFSEDVCYLTNDMLQTAAKEGTAKRLNVLPYPVCAKTGTGEGKNGNVDAYCIGYTKEHVISVWLGNRDNTPINATGGGIPANLALNTFHLLYPNGAPQPFPSCGDVTEVRYDLYEYKQNHRILLADALTPPAESGKELFRARALPQESCTRYSMPKIENPSIFVKNGAVFIELCQTEYYDYIIKRENRSKVTTIYEGKYQKRICDNSVMGGEKYVYTVIPVYKGKEGTPVSLPPISIEKTQTVPDEWWND